MVLLTLDKPYTVHARSIDRNGTGQSPSNYKLSLRNAIKCNDDHYIRATLVSAKVPSTSATQNKKAHFHQNALFFFFANAKLISAPYPLQKTACPKSTRKLVF